MSHEKFKFDITLSFAEEDREFVDIVAERLSKACLRVYYDKYEQIDSWGESLYTHLDDVYRTKARYCVMFISKDYKRKLWTQYEREKAQERAYRENSAYILPFRIDSTPIIGMGDDIAYLSKEHYDEKKLAKAIIDKFDRTTKRSSFRKVICILSSKVGRAVSVTAISGSVLLGLSDNLTPVDRLARTIHERSRQTHCAMCNDGTLSFSSGKGTCSSHKGVDQYVDTVAYRKTMEECYNEAKQISWLGE